MAFLSPRFDTLTLDGVSRRFGEVEALKDVNLSIRRGEFVALLGPSGCGKSTTLNCIAGLLQTTAGEIKLDERRIDTLPPERRGFGMVFQNYALFPHLSVRDNVGFGLKMRGAPKAEARGKIDEAIALVQLQGHEDKLPGQLSGGQQQRVAIARAVVIEPPLVLMDEPLSNLDAKLRLEMRSDVRRIHDSLGVTTIYVTHDQDEALSLADRIVVLRDGVIRQIGTPRELYQHPVDIDVADFMGFSNRLKGVCLDAEGEFARIRLADGTVLEGRPSGALASGQEAVAMVRPDDLYVDDGGELSARVESIEYRGRHFVGTARTADGLALSYRSDMAADVGAEVTLTAAGDRMLVFARGPQ